MGVGEEDGEGEEEEEEGFTHWKTSGFFSLVEIY